jgi:hypothetical protein
MNAKDSPLTSALRRLAHRIAMIVEECRYAQRRMAQLRLAPDRYLAQPGRVPDTYAEFLFRTSGPLAHERSASARAAGRDPVR